MKLTVLQRCKSLLYSRFTGFKVFIFNFGSSHVSKNILKTGMLLHRQPKPRRLRFLFTLKIPVRINRNGNGWLKNS